MSFPTYTTTGPRRGPAGGTRSISGSIPKADGNPDTQWQRSAMRVMLTLDLWANSSASSHLKARIRRADCSELTGARARRSAIGPSWDSLRICLGDSGFTAIRRFGRKQHGSSWFDVRAADATGRRRLTRLKPMRICNSSIRNGLGGFWNAMNGLRRSTKCRNVWPEGEGTKQEPVARLGRLTP